MTSKEENEVKSFVDNYNTDEVLALLLKDVDLSTVTTIMLRNGNRYSRRLLKFFQWLCKYIPLLIMLFHAIGIYDFSQHPREMFVLIEGNTACYFFIYIMVYILPMILILASRFFWLCWRYRIPFFYYFGVNAIHIAEQSIFTTNDMVDAHYALFIMTAMFYMYGFSEMFFKETKLGRKFFS